MIIHNIFAFVFFLLIVSIFKGGWVAGHEMSYNRNEPSTRRSAAELVVGARPQASVGERGRLRLPSAAATRYPAASSGAQQAR